MSCYTPRTGCLIPTLVLVSPARLNGSFPPNLLPQTHICVHPSVRLAIWLLQLKASPPLPCPSSDRLLLGLLIFQHLDQTSTSPLPAPLVGTRVLLTLVRLCTPLYD